MELSYQRFVNYIGREATLCTLDECCDQKDNVLAINVVRSHVSLARLYERVKEFSPECKMETKTDEKTDLLSIWIYLPVTYAAASDGGTSASDGGTN